jgi:hypothetical protein
VEFVNPGKQEQPDFNAVWSNYFGSTPKPVRYELREAPDCRHDLAFLSSLIHDARVENAGRKPVDGCVTLELNRDCWELGYTKRPNCLELHITSSRLKLTGVTRSKWRLPARRRNEDDPWISSIVFHHSYFDMHKKAFKFLLLGEEWRASFTMMKDNWSVVLEDLETPYLWSDRNQGQF